MTASLDYVYGFVTDVNQGLAFHGDRTLLFIAGQMCVSHNLDQDSQKYMVLAEQNIPSAMVRGSKHFLAVADKGLKSSVIVYDLKSSSKKILPDPEIYIEEYIGLSFSSDFRNLAAQGGPPDWALVMWVWDKRKLKTVFQPTGVNPEAKIYEICFHPRDPEQIVAVGKYFFRLYKYEDEEFKQFVFSKYEQHGEYLCVAWLPRERLAIGTADGRIIMFDGIEQRYEITVSDIAPNNSKKNVNKPEDSKKDKLVDNSNDPNPITCVVTTSKGLVCSYGNSSVIEYVRTEDNKNYEFSQSLYLPPRRAIQDELGELEEEVEKIMYMKLNPTEEILVISTNCGQILRHDFLTEDNEKTEKIFKHLFQPGHNDAIIGMDIAVKKPLIITSSKNTVILWDYIKRFQEMRKKFFDEILSVALHPLGLFLVIGFSECTRIFAILTDGLREIELFETNACTEISFSHGGHLLAVANASNIEIYSTIILKRLVLLKGHHGLLSTFVWSENDMTLVSCDSKGAIYKWDVITKQRIAENVVKKTGYSSVAVSPDGMCTFAVGTDCTIREIFGSDIQKEATTGVYLTSLALTYTGDMLFGGTEKGCLRTFRFPLTVTADFIDTSAHFGKITKIKIAYGDEFLMAAGEDGMLSVWKIKAKEDRKKETILFSKDVLIDNDELVKYFDSIQELEDQLEDIKTDYEYEIKIKDMAHEQQTQNVCDNLEKKIEELNTTITQLSNEKNFILSSHQEELIRLKEANLKSIEENELATRKKLLSEYELCDKLNEDNKAMEVTFQKQIEKMEEKNKLALTELSASYEHEIKEKEDLILQEKDLRRQKEAEYQELLKQVEDTADLEIIAVKSSFARELQAQKEEIVNLKETNEMLKMKISYQEKQIDELKQRILNQLTEEGKLKKKISDLDGTLSEQKKDVQLKDNIIKNNENRIFELTIEKQELEKYRYTLISDVTDLHDQIKPKDEEICQLKITNEQLTKEMHDFDSIRNKMHGEIVIMSQKQRSAEKEIKEEKRKLYNMESLLEKYRTEVRSCGECLQNPRRLKESVKRLLDKLIKDKTDESTAADLDLNAEFSHQREHLEKSISVLRKRLEKEGKAHRIEYVRMVQENSELIRSINELRQDLKVSHRRIQDMETALGLTSVEFGSEGSATRQKLEFVVAAVRRNDDETKLKLSRQDDLIQRQQEDIRRLQALLVVNEDGRIVKN